jgi:YcaO-like protein with predicted kinase domain
VYTACRPNSRGLAVAQGKGLDESSARVSAIMEAAEHAVGEAPKTFVRLESYEDLSRKYQVADPLRLPLCKHSMFHPCATIPWVVASSGGESCWVPYELVHTCTSVPAVPGSGAFVQSSNGLASGNNLSEATVHALYEIIERDALALWSLKEESQAATRVDLSTIRQPVNVRLLSRFEAADIDVILWDVTSDIDVPCFRCVIVDRQAHPKFRPMPAGFGSGCHLDPSIAVARAMCEAAQSRLTAISGARDDLTRCRYAQVQSATTFALFDRYCAEKGTIDVARHSSRSSKSFEYDISIIESLFDRAGLGRTLVVDLSQSHLPFSVARVLVEGLEGPAESPQYNPGQRARRLFS